MRFAAPLPLVRRGIVKSWCLCVGCVQTATKGKHSGARAGPGMNVVQQLRPGITSSHCIHVHAPPCSPTAVCSQDAKTKRRIFGIHTSRMTLGEDVNLEEFVMAKVCTAPSSLPGSCSESVHCSRYKPEACIHVCPHERQAFGGEGYHHAKGCACTTGVDTWVLRTHHSDMFLPSYPWRCTCVVSRMS